MELGIRLIFLFPFFCQVGISTKTTKMKGEDYCEVNVHSRKLNRVLYTALSRPGPPYLQRHIRCARCSRYAARRLIQTSPEFLLPCILKLQTSHFFPRNRAIRGPPYLQRYIRCARCTTYAARRLIRTSPEFLVPCILKQAQSVASELCKSEDSWSKKNLSFLQPRKLGDFSGPRFFVLITYRWFDF